MFNLSFKSDEIHEEFQKDIKTEIEEEMAESLSNLYDNEDVKNKCITLFQMGDSTFKSFDRAILESLRKSLFKIAFLFDFFCNIS